MNKLRKRRNLDGEAEAPSALPIIISPKVEMTTKKYTQGIFFDGFVVKQVIGPSLRYDSLYAHSVLLWLICLPERLCVWYSAYTICQSVSVAMLSVGSTNGLPSSSL